MKAYKIPIIVCVSILVLTIAPKTVAAEPSLEINLPTKTVSNTTLDTALSKHSLAQITHGLVVITVLGILALKKR